MPAPATAPQTTLPQPGKNLSRARAAFAQDHSRADVHAERADKLGRRAQTAFAAANVHDAGNHHELKRGQDRQIGQRNRLRADRRADCGRRFHEALGDLALRPHDRPRVRAISTRASFGRLRASIDMKFCAAARALSSPAPAGI